MDKNETKERVKKCAVEGCGKPAVDKVPITLVENNKVKNGYMNLCEVHFNPRIKEVLSLRSEKGEVDIITSKDGKIDLNLSNYVEDTTSYAFLSHIEAKAIIEFLKKALF